jgi:hypothetical protein
MLWAFSGHDGAEHRAATESIDLMPTYSRNDYEGIATAIGKDVTEHENEFEAAATWYRLDSRSRQAKAGLPKAKAASSPKKRNLPREEQKRPSDMRKRMKQIGDAARKLLRRLEVWDYRLAPDGPTDIDLLAFLASAEGGTEHDVIQATARIGRLVEIFEGIDAARFLELRAQEAAEVATQLSGLIPRGHRGSAAQNDWIAAMMSLYEKITGRKARTSIIAPGQPDKGKSAGPLIRFLEAAGKPLGIKHSPHSWRGRIRDNQTGGRRRK